ncbi:MAG: RNA polymerase subunit sigma-70 [Hyphomicrobiales bacterium]|nr:RNA polymerase subunit sigma-70 [Hyphomicrobiales bacterium]
MNKIERRSSPLARNVRRLGHVDLPGAGQVTIAGSYAYVGHIPRADGLGTSILDISDPRNPRVVATVTLDDPESHSHKVRISGNLMIVNHERNMSRIGRRAEQLPVVRRELTQALGREPTAEEMAAKMSVTAGDLRALEEFERRGYHNGGFKIYDISDPTRPKPVCHHKTGGIGVHRFDVDDRYAYVSTEMQGYVGNILVVYDLADPQRPREVSRWWMPGQHLAGGETPTWAGRRHRLHHALRHGNEMWASCWHGGFWVVDVSELTRPKSVGHYNYHPLFPEPTHTVMPVPGRLGNRRIALAVDEEDQAQSASEEEARRGGAHACILTFDVTDLGAIKPLGQFLVSELDSPFSRVGGARFGAHQFCERMAGTLVHAVWFAGGLRIIDVKDPLAPHEVGHFIPEPAGGRPAPQSNDVALDDRGLIYVVDRHVGFDVLEYTGTH